MTSICYVQYENINFARYYSQLSKHLSIIVFNIYIATCYIPRNYLFLRYKEYVNYNYANTFYFLFHLLPEGCAVPQSITYSVVVLFVEDDNCQTIAFHEASEYFHLALVYGSSMALKIHVYTFIGLIDNNCSLCRISFVCHGVGICSPACRERCRPI